ncbi:MAG: MlaD family protein [Spirochaetia bacterium]
MKLRIRFADQVVGVFIIFAFAVFAAILVFMGLNQRWFAKDYYFYSIFPTANGLNQGMSISFRGFTIGKVDTLTLTSDNNVEIRFHIYDNYIEKVTDNSVLELASNPIGIGGGLLFHPGNGFSLPQEEHSYIPSLSTPEGKSLVEAGLVDIPETSDTITRMIGRVEPILINVNETVLSVNSLLYTLEETLEGRSQGPIADILADIQDTTNEIDTMINETTTNANDLVLSLTGISRNLEELTADPTGLVPRLLDPDGSLETILNDDNVLFEQIQAILNDINTTVDNVNEFTRFINGTQPQISGILEEGRNTLNQGQDVLEGLSNNPFLRGGISEQREQPTTFQSFRDEDF